MTSSAFLLPYDTFWNDDEVIISAPTRNYTVKDYSEFFDDINFPNGKLMRGDTENLIKVQFCKAIKHPGYKFQQRCLI